MRPNQVNNSQSPKKLSYAKDVGSEEVKGVIYQDNHANTENTKENQPTVITTRANPPTVTTIRVNPPTTTIRQATIRQGEVNPTSEAQDLSNSISIRKETITKIRGRSKIPELKATNNEENKEIVIPKTVQIVPTHRIGELPSPVFVDFGAMCEQHKKQKRLYCYKARKVICEDCMTDSNDIIQNGYLKKWVQSHQAIENKPNIEDAKSKINNAINYAQKQISEKCSELKSKINNLLANSFLDNIDSLANIKAYLTSENCPQPCIEQTHEDIIKLMTNDKFKEKYAQTEINSIDICSKASSQLEKTEAEIKTLTASCKQIEEKMQTWYP